MHCHVILVLGAGRAYGVIKAYGDSRQCWIFCVQLASSVYIESILLGPLIA